MGFSLVGASRGLLSSCGVQTSHCRGFPRCRARALEHRLNSCGAQASLLRSMWDFPGPRIEPVFPALAGGFFTTEPSGKPFIRFLRQRKTTEDQQQWKRPGQNHRAGHSGPETSICVLNSRSLPYTFHPTGKTIFFNTQMGLVSGHTNASNRWRVCGPAGTAHGCDREEREKILEPHKHQLLLNCAQGVPKQGEGFWNLNMFPVRHTLLSVQIVDTHHAWVFHVSRLPWTPHWPGKGHLPKPMID